MQTGNIIFVPYIVIILLLRIKHYLVNQYLFIIFLNDLGIIEKIKTKVYRLDKFIEEIKNNLN